MNKTNTTKETVENLVLEYDLHSLPTAQHKAGLAGLMMMIESLEQRELQPVPQVLEITPFGAKILFTPDSLQTVFDDLYDAEIVENTINKDDNDNEEEDGEKNTVKPKGKFLDRFYPSPSVIWINLWKDAIWNSLRGIHKTREVYKERADKKPSSLSQKVWDELKDSLEDKSKVQSFSSSLFFGAESKNAEQVKFKGSAPTNFLLHFWVIASRIFVPRVYSLKKEKYEPIGYVFTVPEPSELTSFIDDLKKNLRELETDVVGFRPKISFIDAPDEGGLEYLHSFVQHRTAKSKIAFSISAVEIYHVEKKNRIPRFHEHKRISLNPYVLDKYDSFRNHFSNPFYKLQRVRNLLSGEPWYRGMDAFFNNHPHEYFVFDKETPRNLPFFGRDANKTFNQIKSDFDILKGETRMENSTQVEEQKSNELAVQIRRLIRTYVRLRFEDKTGKKFKEFKANEKGWKNLPNEYKKVISKVCIDAFLAMRSRRDRDFVEYFSGTICSVPQQMSNKYYLVVTQALLEDWETVKTLSMLALSAESSLAVTRDDETDTQGE